MIDLLRESAVPSNLMQSAAKGALAVPIEETIEILVYLATQNPVFGEQARLTLAGWDEASAREAASNLYTAKEVLDYMIAPQNLRPSLLPALLENPAVREEAIVELVAGCTRDVLLPALASRRVGGSAVILHSLLSNPALTGREAQAVRMKLAIVQAPREADSGEEVLPLPEAEPAEPEAVFDEEVNAYLAAHAAELAAEGDRPFQPIGGFYDEFDYEPEEPLAAAAAAAAERAGTGPKKSGKKTGPAGVERGSALQKISKLDVKGRIQLAMKGNKEERSILVRDGTKLVATAVLESPKITDGEVEKFAAQKNVLEAVLRAIPMKRRFAKHYPIVRNLVFNPRTPLDVSLGLMKNILAHDLKNLSGNKEVSETVRKLALKMFKQKMDIGKKDI
ncbi:MAG TPA: hypothetical protein VMH85_21865 [Terriglobales bacterium]|nr:hypothetical protein [Terriglobales bacterium]